MEVGREAERGGGLGREERIRIDAEVAESAEFAEKRNPRAQPGMAVPQEKKAA
jgi:hypothetical protein